MPAMPLALGTGDSVSPFPVAAGVDAAEGEGVTLLEEDVATAAPAEGEGVTLLEEVATLVAAGVGGGVVGRVVLPVDEDAANESAPVFGDARLRRKACMPVWDGGLIVGTLACFSIWEARGEETLNE